MTVKIRQVEVSDAEQLLHYIQKVGSESDNLLFGPEGLALTVVEMKSMLLKMKQNQTSILLVAEKEGELMGSAQLVGNRRHRTRHRANLAISVSKSYWNQGIGSRLLNRLIEFARQSEIEQIVLEVRSDNQSAIGLYRKFGFVYFGKLPRYFKINMQYFDADYMWLQLK